ncbi:unnamed protein product [Blepharisma stoltei]|uniref:Uncharacterized protein n=1 Tax=Blepharisma stoltei TaxID=1481888 RepID=A0AAU9J235_9CILI|nr:unnamed protein product [Blepharisma stoltei]
MNQERGRVYKDKLDQISNEYASLHSIFKKLIKSEEESLENHLEFQQKWQEVAELERHNDLANVFLGYSNSLKAKESAHTESLGILKDYIQDALRIASLKIKQQKRSLSRRENREKTAQERSKSLQKTVNSEEINKENEENEKELKMMNEETQRNIKEFENRHVNDIKQVLLHLMNAEMFHHSVALQQLTNLLPLVQNIDPENLPKDI